MLIVALVLAVIGLAALVTAVVTSNELVAWVCIGASALGVVLLVVDAIRDRKQRRMEALEARTEPPFIGVAAASAAAGAATVAVVGGDAPAEVAMYSVDEDGEGIDYGYHSEEVSDADADGDLDADADADGDLDADADADGDLDDLDEDIREEDFPEEVVHDEPEFDTYGDDEVDFPEPAEEAAMHTVVIYESENAASTQAAIVHAAGDADFEDEDDSREGGDLAIDAKDRPS